MGKFVRKNNFLMLYTFFICIVTYGIKLFNTNYGVDTTNMIGNFDGTLAHWLSLGRPGLVLLKLFTFGYVNVYSLTVLTIVTFCIANILLMYYFSLLLKQRANPYLLILIPSLFATHQLFAEQFYFVLQSFEFSVGICLVILALIGLEEAVQYKFVYFLFLIFADTIYQSMIPFTFVLLLTRALFHYYQLQKENSRVNVKQFVVHLCKMFSIMLSTILASQCIAVLIRKSLHIPKNAYLSDMIRWGKYPIRENIQFILNYISEVLNPSESKLFTHIFVLGIMMSLAVIIRMLLAKKKNSFYMLFFILGITMTPFAIAFVQGGRPSAREEVPTLPMAIVALILFFMVSIRKTALFKAALCVVLYFSLRQFQQTTNLLFSDQMRYENDLRFTASIVAEINNLALENTSSYKLLIFGNREFNSSLAQRGEMLSNSFYVFGGNTLATSHVVLMYYNTLGIYFDYPTQEDYDKYLENSRTMGKFPNQNSVIVIDDTIIVNL